MRNPPFWARQVETLSMVLILSSPIPSTHQNSMHPLIRLMSCFLQSLWPIYALLLLFLIVLDCTSS